MCNAAKRPWPQLDEDDVVDYMIMEAVATKIGKEDEEIREKAKVDEWRKESLEGLNKKVGNV